MKSTIRELATDLKAAVLIGDQESLFFALNGVRALDDDALSVNNLLLLGKAVRALPMNTLKELLTDVDPAVRGVAAVGLAGSFGSGKDPKAKFLRRSASDPHAAVREAFAEALAAAGNKPTSFQC